MSVQLAKVGTSTSVVLGGDLDALTAPELDGIIGGVIALDDGSVTVDLSGLGFMGAAGARSLLSAHRELTEVGRKLDLIDAPPTVARLLAIVGLQVVETLP
ncbi:MAG: STAS domain-containing protein [Acidimicrobiia bacterium]|nr:STAS domain-containing protein [Acidimicrobiia bacterium]